MTNEANWGDIQRRAEAVQAEVDERADHINEEVINWASAISQKAVTAVWIDYGTGERKTFTRKARVGHDPVAQGV